MTKKVTGKSSPTTTSVPSSKAAKGTRVLSAPQPDIATPSLPTVETVRKAKALASLHRAWKAANSVVAVAEAVKRAARDRALVLWLANGMKPWRKGSSLLTFTQVQYGATVNADRLAALLMASGLDTEVQRKCWQPDKQYIESLVDEGFLTDAQYDSLLDAGRPSWRIQVK